MMWCAVTSATCSLSSTRTRAARQSGPVARWKGRAACAAVSVRSAASREAGGSARRSTTGSVTGAGGSITWTGPAAVAPTRVRSTACRATTAARLWSSRPPASAPRSRTAAGM